MATQTLPHHCAICQTTKPCLVVTVVHRPRFAVLTCQHCAFVFTVAWPCTGVHHAHPSTPDPETSTEYWTDAQIASEEQLFPFYRAEAAELLAWLPIQRGRLLDLGCSLGVLLDEARQAGFHAEGLEASPRAAQYAQQRFGVPVHVGTLETTSIGSFDAVVANDVLEHQLDPIALLQQIAAVVRPGGSLLIETPSAASLHARLYRIANEANNRLRCWTNGRWDYPWGGYYGFDHDHSWQAGHVSHFSIHTLNHAAALAGFAPLRHALVRSRTWYLAQRAGGLGSPRAWIVLLVQALSYVFRAPNKLVALYTRVPTQS